MDEEKDSLQMDEDENEDEKTLSVPMWVPLSVPSRRDIFYVRKCYDEYYNQLMDLLKAYNSITVTGTPGIGKSMFYLYFFQRYRKEFPLENLVTASFEQDRTLMRCALFRQGSSLPFVSGGAIPLRFSLNWPSHFDCNLFLYDGPPKKRPDCVKMIAFTSPNYGWLNSMRTDETHAIVYMPAWTHEELQEAVNALNLDISKEELQQRFDFFGGSARYCLATDAVFLDRARNDVEGAKGKIDSHQQLEDFFSGNLDQAKVVHCLMSYQPETNNQFAKLVPASDQIEVLLEARFSTLLSQEREKFMNWLEGAGKASVFQGWLFESMVHETLLKEGDFKIRSLLNSTVEPLHLNGTIGEYERFNSNISADDAIMDVYRIPKSSNQPSIDSFMETESCFLMFQITIQSKHEIKASGLVNLLGKLEKLEGVEEHPESAKIIFVVPERIEPQYKEKQKIAFENRVEANALKFLTKIPQYVLVHSYKTGNVTNARVSFRVETSKGVSVEPCL